MPIDFVHDKEVDVLDWRAEREAMERDLYESVGRAPCAPEGYERTVGKHPALAVRYSPTKPFAEAPKVWLQTLRSGAFDLENPTSDMVDFEAMAVVLARTYRFGGHTQIAGYPVAQHLVEGARAIIRDHKRYDWAAAYFLHDGHEYVIGDIATPVQMAIQSYLNGENIVGYDAISRTFKAMKSRVDRAIYEAAGINYPLTHDAQAIVREYDIRMCRTERDANLATPPYEWVDIVENAAPVLGCDLHPWPEARARLEFLDQLYILCPAIFTVCS